MTSWLPWLILPLLLLQILLVRTVIRGRTDAKRLNDYFVKAAIVHTWLGDEDAKLAAVAASRWGWKT